MGINNIILEVVTPYSQVVNEPVQIVMVPGIMGEFGILVGHTPFLSILKTGVLHFSDKKGNKKYVFINGGFAETLPDKVTVLAETAERNNEIDINRAKEAMKRAEERISKYLSGNKDIDFERAKAALNRSIYRISIINA